MAVLPFVTRQAIEGWLKIVSCPDYELAVKGIHWVFCNGMLLTQQPNGDHVRIALFKTKRSSSTPVVLCCEKDMRSRVSPEIREFRVVEVRLPTTQEQLTYERSLAKAREVFG